jgi:hypothetical protein
MLAHRIAVLGPGKLHGVLQSLLDAISTCPSIIGVKTFTVRLFGVYPPSMFEFIRTSIDILAEM